MAVAFVVAGTPTRSRSRRLPGLWAFLAILLYAALEAATNVLASVGLIAEARWTIVVRAAVVLLNVLAWRSLLLAAYPAPAPDTVAEPLAPPPPEDDPC